MNMDVSIPSTPVLHAHFAILSLLAGPGVRMSVAGAPQS